MRKFLTTAVTCIALGASAIAPVSAAPRHHNNGGDRQQFMQNYCSSHNDSDCRDWNNHRDRWDDARYHSWYQRHRHDRDFGDNGVAALFGFAAGAAASIITGGASNGPACMSFRTYDRSTNTYIGNDRRRHTCR